MADLAPLIRLRKYGVEEKQKILADLFREAEALEARKADFLAQVEKERCIAEKVGDFDTHAAFTLFANRARQAVDGINATLKRLDVRIAKAQDEMREAFGEMKKVEIIQRRRQEEERAAEDRRESQILDEVGIEGFRRKEEDD
jgi:flagellar FliJ protein